MRQNFKFLFAFFALTLFAQQKVGYIDSQRILMEYKKAQEIRSEFDKKVREWKEEVSRRQVELEKLQKNLQSQSFMLTEEARMRKIEELQKKKTELENYVNEIYRKEGKAEVLNKELMQPLLQEIDTVVSEIAQEEEYTYILDASTGVVIYADDIYDITDRIIEALNRKHAPQVEGEKTEYYVFKFKEEDSESKSRTLGVRIKRLISVKIQESFGTSFREILPSDLSSAESSLAIDDEEEVSSNAPLAVQFIDVSGIDFVLIGRVWMVTGNIYFEYSIVDKKEERIVFTKEVNVGVEENLTERIAVNVMPEIAKLYK